MAENAILTPPSVHRATAPPRGPPSPLITGLSTLSSPTDRTVDMESTDSRPRRPSPPRDTPACAMERLSDDDAESAEAALHRHGDVEPPTLACVPSPSPSSDEAPPPLTDAPHDAAAAAAAHITAADYADRQRLLYHITYLGTQLQRAQLQVEDLTRTVCVLRGAASPVRAALKPDATAAAVLAAQEEKDVHTALQAALAVFDPVIAQTQIYRLDDALAQLSLLREAELAQLRKSSAALKDHRALVGRLSEEAAQLRSRVAALEQQKGDAEMKLRAAQLEVEQLRHEEQRLNRRVVGLEELAQDGTWMSGVRMVGGSSSGGAATPLAGPSPSAQLEREEAAARQALLQELFWDPMLIAFDAGLTWLSDCAAFEAPAPQPAAAAAVGSTVAAVADERDLLSLAQAGILVASPAPPTDADLLLLRRQQEEVSQLRSRVQLLQERHRVGQLENERLQFLYEGEVRRSERMAQDHAAQLQQAYDEVVRDRQYIMNKLRQEVEDQIRLAYEDGRAYERSSCRSRSRRSQKPALRTGNGVL